MTWRHHFNTTSGWAGIDQVGIVNATKCGVKGYDRENASTEVEFSGAPFRVGSGTYRISMHWVVTWGLFVSVTNRSTRSWPVACGALRLDGDLVDAAGRIYQSNNSWGVGACTINGVLAQLQSRGSAHATIVVYAKLHTGVYHIDADLRVITADWLPRQGGSALSVVDVGEYGTGAHLLSVTVS